MKIIREDRLLKQKRTSSKLINFRDDKQNIGANLIAEFMVNSMCVILTGLLVYMIFFLR